MIATTLAAAVIAAIGDNLYNVVLLLHFVTILVGGGLGLLGSLFVTQARRRGGRALEDATAAVTNQIVFPALLLAGVAGGALVGLSDDVWDFSQTWLAIAGPLWLVALTCSLIGHPPSWLNVFNAEEHRRRQARIGLQISLILLLIDMIWKDSLW